MSCHTIRLQLRAALVRGFAAACLALALAPTVFCHADEGSNNEIPYPAPDSGGIGSSGIVSGASLSVPGFSSRPGAPYTIYLDFGGFSYTGNWGFNFSYNPGVTPAYDIDGNPSTFNATELANIKNVWSRTAEKYSWANVNVTTVDPAPANVQAAGDSARQDWYDSQAQMMHTVIGGNSSWVPNGPAGGLSWLTKTGHAQIVGSGYHTDFVFSNVTATSSTNLQFIGEAAAHENGHGFGLNHQSVYNGNTFVTEYNPGTAPVGSPPTPGSKAPIMGVSYYLERGLWRIGTSDPSGNGSSPPVPQNDIATILNTGNNPNIAIINDGVGHALANATALPMIGTTIDFTSAMGVITPTSTNPSTSGAANYTTDFWSFTSPGGNTTITVNAGRESITPGVPDPGATLDATLDLFDANGNLVASAATISLSETISASLAAGSYYAEVLSAADPSNSGYFDVGSYFLTGDITAVPEPAAVVLMALAGLALTYIARQRRSSYLPH